MTQEPGAIAASEIETWLASLDRAPNTRGKALQIVRSIFDAARRDRIITVNPAADACTFTDSWLQPFPLPLEPRSRGFDGPTVDSARPPAHPRGDIDYARGVPEIRHGSPRPGEHSDRFSVYGHLGERVHGAAANRSGSARLRTSAAPTRPSVIPHLVVALIGAVATHTGPMATPDGVKIPATGKSVQFPYCIVVRFENGEAVQLDEYFDRLDLLTQLGVA